MYILLISLLVGSFLGMLFVNIYFRAKVMKTYKTLVQNKVEFGASHIFNKTKMEQEILPRYPKMREDILLFVRHIRYSICIAVLLIALISCFGAILMYYR